MLTSIELDIISLAENHKPQGYERYVNSRVKKKVEKYCNNT